MFSVNSAITFITDWLSEIRFTQSQQRRTRKIRDYTGYEPGRDYLFESIDGGAGGYMTGQGKGIERGDYLILPDGSGTSRYRVDEIDYYSNPSDMWIALLKPVPTEPEEC
jgi:MioC protein